MIYFTADLHFGHKNVIDLCGRPFASVEEMDAALTRNWNETVTQRDEVYVLGDFTMKTAETAHGYLSILNGRKYLVRGNHDWFADKIDSFGRHFEWVKDYHVFKYHRRKFVLFHYPIAEWDGFHRGAVHLHGHTHNRAPCSPELTIGRDATVRLAFNVGVDCTGFRPIGINEIIWMAESLSLF
jgi:calcineurin-like phosphoesterase family protein